MTTRTVPTLPKKEMPRQQGVGHKSSLFSLKGLAILAIAALAIVFFGSASLTQRQSSQWPNTLVPHLEKVAKTHVDICQDDVFQHTVCQDNLDIPRHHMPQVEGAVLQNYLDTQRSDNVSVRQVLVHARDLKPIQKEMNAGKILSMIQSLVNRVSDFCITQPILAAQQRVIDGHHRFAACSILNRDISVIQVDKNASTVLHELKTFPGVKYVNLATF